MGDFDKELDASVEAAGKVLAESEALLETAEKERQAYREWQNANQIDEAKLDRFFASLPPEERKRVEQEREAFERELAEDLEKAVQKAAFPARENVAPAKKGKRRSYA